MGLILARQIGTFVSVLLRPLFFCECGGREQAFRDGAEVKTVNGQIVLRPVIQGKALSTTPVTSARERSPQWHKFGFNCTFDEQIMSGCIGAHQQNSSFFLVYANHDDKKGASRKIFRVKYNLSSIDFHRLDLQFVKTKWKLNVQ